VHRIIFTKSAAKSLQKMPRNPAKLIREKLEVIAADPHTDLPNTKKLHNRPGFRLRVGDWRVIYEIQDKQLIILVLKIAPRGEVYREG
jgi:mRNA interferase RelE/StbE